MKSQNEQTNFSSSQNLLILQNRQIVHHILSIQDWIVLSIYTPNQHDYKPNFNKHKNSPSKHQTNNQQSAQQSQDITNLLSVLAIRTEMKPQQTNNYSFKCNHQPKHKQSIGEIKMIHKEIRVQNIIEWSVQNQSFQQHFQQRKQHQTQPKYFLILSYTKIQLYTVSATLPSSIHLTQVFSTPFLIPFNIINLKNDKLSLKTQQNKPKLQKDYAKRLLSDEKGQKYKIGMVGIDRSKTFWSGYYEIETSKRSLYLLSDFIIKPKEGNQRKYEQKIKPIETKQSPRILRRVRSAQNIFEVSNKSIYLQKQSQKNKKQQLSSTQLNPRQNKVDDRNAQADRKQYCNKSPKDQFQNVRSYKSPESAKYTQVSADQLQLSNSDRKSVNRLKEFRQPEVSIPRQQRTDKKGMRRQQIQPRILPTQIKYDTEVQLSPSLIFSSRQTSPQESPSKKSSQSLKLVNRHLFSYNHGSTKCHPPIQHIHHFYSQTLVPIKVEFRGSHIQSYSNKKRYRKEHELMVLVGYLNVVALVNVDREETVSRVNLDPNVSVCKSLQISSIFGIFSAIILTKSPNITSQPSDKSHTQNKLIKVSIDTINHQQLGMGLQPIKMLCFSQGEYVIDCQPIWNSNLPGHIEQFIQKLKHLHEEEQQMTLKQSYEEVMMDLMGELRNQEEEECEEKKKHVEGIKYDYGMRDGIKENREEQTISKMTESLDSWMGVPINQLQYCFIITTSLSRMLLYNHIRLSKILLFDSSNYKNQTSQTLSQPQLSNQTIHKILSINKLAVTPIHIRYNKDDINSKQATLSAKLALLYSTDINNFIAKCNHPNLRSFDQPIPISLIQELKHFTF